MAEKNETPAPQLVITRLIKAPQATVWRMFTEAQHLAHWWGPKETTLEVLRLDLEPGGIFHYSMNTGNGHKMYGRFTYRELSPVSRMVFISSFADEKGQVVRAPFFDGQWPLEIYNELTLVPEGEHTRLVLRGHPIHCTPEEKTLFESHFPSMNNGFNGTFDQLDVYLGTLDQTDF